MRLLQVYKASAGAGKTYKLALKYITLLLGYFKDGKLCLYKGKDLRRHREILAITFTNKATQEMRRRIVNELALLASGGEKPDYLRDIHLMIDPEDVGLNDSDIDRRISLAAGRALDSMLFDFGEMQISTIDAFFQRVLRSFAYEADLSGNYELMLENEQMTDMAISDMLAHACGMKGVAVPEKINSEYLRQQIRRLILAQAANGEEYKVFSPDSRLRNQLTKFIDKLSNEDYLAKNKTGAIESFLARPNTLSNLVEALMNKRRQLLDLLATDAERIKTCAAGEKLSKVTLSFLDKVASGGFKNKSVMYSRLLVDEDYISCLNKNNFDESIIEDFTKRMSAFCQTLKTIKSIDALTDNVNFLGLFREVLIMRQELKAHLNTILLSDTNELLHRIIDECDSPFIYERIGRQLHHFLIDEFQDTSKMQWENLRPLLSESLSQGYENLIIGDVKQCIYRFRNSSPELLANDIHHTPDIAPYIESCSLDDNWRSSPVVVNFNNELFASVASRADVDGNKACAYLDVRQNPKQVNIEGYVNVATYPQKEIALAYERMIEHMQRQLSNGYSPGDIVVLARSNKDAQAIVVVLLDAVRSGKLPVGTMIVSDEALNVSSAQSVKWIVNRLHEMNGMVADDGKINSRGLRRATNEDIDWLQEHLLQANAGSGEKALEKVISEFNEYRNSSASNDAKRLIHTNGQTITELVEQLIRELPDPELAKDEVQYICAFQDLVLDYCNRSSPTLQGFLKLWDEQLADKAAVGLAEGVNAIRVLTIHKSKGLEFNCVHIPLVKKQFDKNIDTSWYDVESFMTQLNLGVPTPKYYPLDPGTEQNASSLKYTAFAGRYKELCDDQTIDEINALYVAFTRARQELIVTIQDPRSDNNKKASHLNHPFGLLCPIIQQMSGHADAPWTFGAPTRKYQSNSDNTSSNRYTISKYITRKRPEMWSQTRAAATADSGEPL